MLRGVVTLFVLVTATVGLGLVATVFALLRPGSDVTLKVARVWSRVLLLASGVRPEYHGLEHAAGARPCVFVSNHQSMVDIWALIPVLPDRTRFVAKRSLFRVPVLGWAMASAGYVPVDRQRLGRAIRSLDTAAAQVRAGHPFVLFAEGTRSRDGRLGKFKKGPFHLALQSRASVVPVAISGTFSVIRPRSLRVRPGRVRVSFGEPIDVAPYLPEDVAGLSQATRRAIAGHLDPRELDEEDTGLRASAR